MVTLIVIGAVVVLIVALVIARAIMADQRHGQHVRRPPGSPGS